VCVFSETEIKVSRYTEVSRPNEVSKYLYTVTEAAAEWRLMIEAAAVNVTRAKMYRLSTTCR